MSKRPPRRRPLAQRPATQAVGAAEASTGQPDGGLGAETSTAGVVTSNQPVMGPYSPPDQPAGWWSYAAIMGILTAVLVLCVLPFAVVPSLRTDAFAVWFLMFVIWLFVLLGCVVDAAAERMARQ